MSEEIENHVLERYEVYKKMGRGAYGIVWKAKDKRTKKTVALKKVFEAFQNSVDAQRTYREVMYLQELNGHNNIVRLLSIIRAYNNKDLYLVFEYMETDLHSVIKAKILDNIHKKFIVYQLLKGLKYIHSADLLHRDLKPSNLLINSDCNIKIADFGLARSVAAKDNGEELIVSDYVATRWYRAPEILLGSQKYSKAVDIWSAGCIFAELIHGKTLFAGKSTINQIELIIELLGNPSKNDVIAMNSPLAENILSAIKSSKKRSFTHLFGGIGKEGLDLLRKMMKFNPVKRISVEEALNHKFFERFHCLEDEIVCDRVIRLPIDDNIKLSLKMYRDAIYKDIALKMKKRTKDRRNKKEKLPEIRRQSMSRERNGSVATNKTGSPSKIKRKEVRRAQKSQQYTKSTLNSRSQKRSGRNRKSKSKLRDFVKSPKRPKPSSKRMKRFVEASAKNFIRKHVSKNPGRKSHSKMFMRKKSKAEKSKKKKANVKLYRSISPSTGKELFHNSGKKSNVSHAKFFKTKKSLQSSSHYLLNDKSKKKSVPAGGGFNMPNPAQSRFLHRKSSSFVNMDRKVKMSKANLFGKKKKKSSKRIGGAYGGYFFKGKSKGTSKYKSQGPSYSFKA